MERALYICLEDGCQSVVLSVRDRAVLVQANLQTVSEVQESSIQGPHCP
jgi:hypothetical protein